ncbi:MAG TPA: hypothetical protein ENH01_07965 [Nitrospirae bacterium]|nr:hypothetical protein [Nitrospirota bacterium]
MENKLFLAKGTLRVAAKGYWFTSGGEKGSFGYYPHLKDKRGLPVFPDTQIHGDLKMSAGWLKSLDSSVKDDLIAEVFGRGGEESDRNLHPRPSRLYISDLVVNDGAASGNIFDIKPRIEIEEDKRTAKKHMLVSLEMSYLEGKKLEAEVYLGYFDNRTGLDNAKKLVEESAQLLSGFGAFRSRGYGRGEMELEWEEDIAIEYKDTDKCDSEFIYYLEALVNFRNKPIEPGSYQNIETLKHITSDQLRGWFVNAYEN